VEPAKLSEVAEIHEVFQVLGTLSRGKMGVKME